MPKDEIVDFTKLARKAARQNQCPHAGHDYKMRRNGVERCQKCGDEFPCRRECWHVDCWVRRLNLGIVEHYPTKWAMGGMMIRDRETGTVYYDTTADDPVDWILPTSDTKVEDVT